MNELEKQRLAEALKSAVNMYGEANNFIAMNAKQAPGKLAEMLKAAPDAETKKQLKEVVIPAFEKAKKAAETANAELLKLDASGRDPKEIAGCADAKAFRDKHAKRGEAAKAFHEAGKAYALALLIDAADVKKLGSAKNLAGLSKAMFRGMGEVSIKVTVTAVEMFDHHFEEFRAKWNALGEPAKAPPRPASPPPRPATPPRA